MSRKFVLTITLIALISMLGLTSKVQKVKATGTIYIRADGSVDGTTYIQSDDNITWVLAADINDSIVIERSNIIVDGNAHAVQGSGNGYGFNLTVVSNVTIKNTSIRGFLYGIRLDHSNHTSIHGNNVTANDDGINIYESSNNSISGNNVIANMVSGVYIDGGSYVSAYSRSNYNNIMGNNVAKNKWGIYLQRSNSSNVTQNNVAENTAIGIVVSGDRNLLVGNNVTENNGTGILLDSSENAELKNNTMTGNGRNFNIDMGLFPSELQNDVDASNLVDGKPIYYWTHKYNMTVPFDAGCVILLWCKNITAADLTLTCNGEGIIMGYVTNSTICRNNITNNNDCGIWLIESYDNHLYCNNLVENHNGVWFNWAERNHFHHNSFVRNKDYQAYTQNWKNVWDDGYPSGGNYWSRNPSGVDFDGGQYQNESGSDGICDTPYVIDGTNTDQYPLMGDFSDFNAASEDDVQTVCNSSISGFQFNGTAIIFNVAGQNGTTGFCRICIPTSLMNETYRVFVNVTEISFNVLPCSNSTHSYLYFKYTHPTQEVIITPEFPFFLILPIFMVITLLAVIVYRRKHDRSIFVRKRIGFV